MKFIFNKKMPILLALCFSLNSQAVKVNADAIFDEIKEMCLEIHNIANKHDIDHNILREAIGDVHRAMVDKKANMIKEALKAREVAPEKAEQFITDAKAEILSTLDEIMTMMMKSHDENDVDDGGIYINID